MKDPKSTEQQELDILLEWINQFGYAQPTAVQRSERPDFILTCGEQTIGLETTFAVPQAFVRATKLQARQCPNEPFFTQNLQDGSSRPKTSDLLKPMFDTEQEWKPMDQELAEHARKTVDALQAKQTKLNTPGFQLFAENWVLITDIPGIGKDSLTYQEYPKILGRALLALRKPPLDFDTVFIRSADYLFHWRNGSLVLVHSGLNKVSRVSL